jgi:hypothetical protein
MTVKKTSSETCRHKSSRESIRPSEHTNGGWMLLRHCRDCGMFLSTKFSTKKLEVREQVIERMES